ncbi:CRS2-associated factor [Vigna angularis]|uniref:CRS2-associated factor n=1 Tax=Phaseolus angularis TaxID=3914 RepID=A0A8T0JPN3_PHAAN|nr:CRS2-associated factor [Vigna angularis]
MLERFRYPWIGTRSLTGFNLFRVLAVHDCSVLVRNRSIFNFHQGVRVLVVVPLQLIRRGNDGNSKRFEQEESIRERSGVRTCAIPVRSNDLPFDFRFSYTESSPKVRPIGLREPKYSPFGPGRLDRKWTGVCAPAVDPTVESLEGAEDPKLEEQRKKKREMIQGKPLTTDERKALVSQFERSKTNRHVNLGRDGLTHNMLNVIHNHWKFAEAVRIKCMGVPTMDMKNICTQLEDKTFGKVVFRHGGTLILYRGRNYSPKKRSVVPLMLWKPHEPVYPRLIKTTIDGLSIEETKKIRKRGLAVPALTKLAKNGYYAFLVPMVRDAFLSCELVRIDCEGLERKDYKKIGCKLRDMVPCILVTFENEQVVVWRGKDYKPPKDGYFLKDRESFEDNNDDLNVAQEQQAI